MIKQHLHPPNTQLSSQTLDSKNEPAKPPVIKSCPKCGSDMVLRTAKKGPEAGNQFWGCSAFPKCRAIADVGEGKREASSLAF